MKLPTPSAWCASIAYATAAKRIADPARKSPAASANWIPRRTRQSSVNCVPSPRHVLYCPPMPFSQLGLDAKILRSVQEAGYTEPTPIQTAAIPPIIAGHDLIGIAQTGTGKTAAFTLPILSKLAALPPNPRRRTKLLVIAPTRELV